MPASGNNWGNTENAFGWISRSFHWLIALMILVLLILGFWMEGLTPNPFKFEMYGLHKAFGILVLFLGALRLIWRFTQTVPLSLPTHAGWERFLSKTIHIVLYISIIGMPLSGWVMSSAGGHPVSIFGLFEMPALVEKNKEISGAARLAHELFAYALIGAVGLHIIGALKHHVIDHDETLRRMGGSILVAFIGLVLLLVSAGFVAQNFWAEFHEQPVVVSAADDSGDP